MPDTHARPIVPIAAGDHVVVIGAGPAGLTAAYQLATRGLYRVTVLEADTQVGGISRTACYKGYRFDIGGHRFFTRIAAVEALWHEWLGPEFISVPRLSRIHHAGHFFDYPLRAGNALRGLGPINAVLIVLSYLKWHWKPYPVEDTFEQWVTNRFGRRLYETFFKTYTEKVWGIPCSEIRAEWAAQRIQGLSLARAILNGAGLNKRADTIKSLIHTFQYPRLGPGQMWEACRDRVVGSGHDVLMEHKVEALESRDGRVTAVQATHAGETRRIEADHVISTMPIRSLVRALRPEPPAEVREAAEGLRYRDFIVVAIVLDKVDLFPDNWIYVHTPGVKVGRIQNFNNWSAALVPTPGTTCLGMEYFCFKGDGLWESSDEALLDQAARELEALGLARRADIIDGTVIRVPKAYPIYDSSYRAHLDVVRAHVDAVPNLHTVGRNGLHKYNNQDHSMLSAMQVVENLHGASFDVWDVNTESDYHEARNVDPGTAGASQ